MIEPIIDIIAGLITFAIFAYVFWLLIRWLRATVINAEKRNKEL